MSYGKDSLDLSTLGAAIRNDAELSGKDKANLVELIKNTLMGLAERDADVLESLEPNVRKRVEALRVIQSQHGELEAKFFERAAPEAKYQKMHEPLYSKSYEVEVEGVIKDGTDKTAANKKEEKGVPDFLLNAMKNHEILAEEAAIEETMFNLYDCPQDPLCPLNLARLPKSARRELLAERPELSAKALLALKRSITIEQKKIRAEQQEKTVVIEQKKIGAEQQEKTVVETQKKVTLKGAVVQFDSYTRCAAMDDDQVNKDP